MVNKKDPVRGEAPVRRSKLIRSCSWLLLACKVDGPKLCLALLELYILYLFDYLRALITSSPQPRALVTLLALRAQLNQQAFPLC